MGPPFSGERLDAGYPKAVSGGPGIRRFLVKWGLIRRHWKAPETTCASGGLVGAMPLRWSKIWNPERAQLSRKRLSDSPGAYRIPQRSRTGSRREIGGRRFPGERLDAGYPRVFSGSRRGGIFAARRGILGAQRVRFGLGLGRTWDNSGKDCKGGLYVLG